MLSHNNVEHVSIGFNPFMLIFVVQPQPQIVFRLDKETIPNVNKSVDIVNVYWIQHVWDRYKSMHRFHRFSTTHKYKSGHRKFVNNFRSMHIVCHNNQQDHDRL